MGVNLFKFGFIGSLDGYNLVGLMDEDNYFGKIGINDLILESCLVEVVFGNLLFRLRSVVGLVGVWVKENIREVIFEVM